MRVAFRVGVVLLSAMVLQRGLFSEVRIAGVSVDVLLALAIGAGMALGADRGAIVGFASGLLFDLMVPTPLGLSALTSCLAAFAAGRLYGPTVQSSRLLRALLAAGLSAATVVLYAVLAQVMGQELALSGRLVGVVVVVAAGNVVLVPLARRAVGWAWPDELSRLRALR